LNIASTTIVAVRDPVRILPTSHKEQCVFKNHTMNTCEEALVMSKHFSQATR